MSDFQQVDRKPALPAPRHLPHANGDYTMGLPPDLLMFPWILLRMRYHLLRLLPVFTTVLVLASSPILPKWAHGGELLVERVFGPEVKTGPYKHPSCMTELQNGDLFLVYYGGASEYDLDTGVFGSRRRKGSHNWSPPRKIAHDPFRSVGNAVVWEAPDGVVWLFYVVRYGDTWSASRVHVKVSHDSADSWSDSSLLVLDEGTLVRNRPIVLRNGDYLLPLYHETGHDTESTGPDSYSFFLRYVAKDKTWIKSQPIRSSRGNIQPAVVQLSDTDLVAYCRRGGDYKPETKGYIVRSQSHDGGWTWSEGKDSSFPNPNAAVDLLKLHSGSLMLVYNDSMTRRTPLTVARSTDEDRTWPVRRNLREGNNDFGYPIAFESVDGRIHVCFTSDRRTVVNHALFDEDWIIHGQPR
jgi:predicted neuraminidase